MPQINTLHSLLLVAVFAGVTALIRALPFLCFGRRVPPVILYLEKVLPFAIIGMLVVYCLKEVDFLGGSHGLPELVCIAVVAALHKWRHNVLLSIGGGTVLYMVLVQTVFL